MLPCPLFSPECGIKAEICKKEKGRKSSIRSLITWLCFYLYTCCYGLNFPFRFFTHPALNQICFELPDRGFSLLSIIRPSHHSTLMLQNLPPSSFTRLSLTSSVPFLWAFQCSVTSTAQSVDIYRTKVRRNKRTPPALCKQRE